MQSYEDDNERGLVYGYVPDGEGGAGKIRLEELELARERVSLLQEAEHQRGTERMKRTMYILGIITGLFMPMSFVTGLLGINVDGIPGAEHPSGFLLA